ncbi:hypothetical protein BJ508DRAFT_307093 [Ascobolus immersus RN42]|uniref:Uncharacterized protein n=1 Tax=Ascobolus immersus RN42 TaxID=1160509 RepID=A0A3N4IGV6_ASCIM|nr:hypothetical protein BJ508DRAFT_307093 [Ascobolus immersus RN42]
MSAIIFPFVNFARYTSSVASSFVQSIHEPLTSTPAQRRAAAESEGASPIKVPRRSASTTSLSTESVLAGGRVLAREQPKNIAFEIVEERRPSEESSALVKTGEEVEAESEDMRHQRGWYEPVAQHQQKEGKGKAPIRDWEAGSPAETFNPADVVVNIPSETDSIPSGPSRRGFTGRLLRLPFTILASVWNIFFKITLGNLRIRAPDLEEGRLQIAANAYNTPVSPIQTNVGTDVSAEQQQPHHVEKRTEQVPGSAVDEMSPVDTTASAVFPAVPTTTVTPPVSEPIAIAVDESEVVSEKPKTVTETVAEPVSDVDSPQLAPERMVKIGEIRSRTPSILDEPIDTAHNSPAVPAAPEVPLTPHDGSFPGDQVEGYLTTVEEEDEDDIESRGRGPHKKPAAAPAEELKKVVEEEEKSVRAESPEAILPETQAPTVETVPTAPAAIEPAQPEARSPTPEAEEPVKAAPEVAPIVVEEKKEEIAIEVEPTPVPSIADAAPAVEVAPEVKAPVEEAPAKLEVDVEAETTPVPEKIEAAPVAAPVAEKPVEAEAPAQEPVPLSKTKRRMSWLPTPKKDEEVGPKGEEKPSAPQRSWTVRRQSTSAAGIKTKPAWKPTKKDTPPATTPASETVPSTTTTTAATTPASEAAPSVPTSTETTPAITPAAEVPFEKPNLMKRMSWTPSKNKDRPANMEKRSSWASSFKLDKDKTHKTESKKSFDAVSIASNKSGKTKLGSMFRRATSAGSIPTTAASSRNELPTSTPPLAQGEFPPTPPLSIQESKDSMRNAKETPKLGRSTSTLVKGAEVLVSEDGEKKKKESSKMKWKSAGKAIGAFKLGKK